MFNTAQWNLRLRLKGNVKCTSDPDERSMMEDVIGAKQDHDHDPDRAGALSGPGGNHHVVIDFGLIVRVLPRSILGMFIQNP